MTTFSVGETVTVHRYVPDFKIGDSGVIISIEDIPPERIKLNPRFPTTSGYGHPQLLTVDVNGKKHVISGLWFED